MFGWVRSDKDPAHSRPFHIMHSAKKILNDDGSEQKRVSGGSEQKQVCLDLIHMLLEARAAAAATIALGVALVVAAV
jgi:hypothetical protein